MCAYQLDPETGDLVISGFETGIAASPHKGIGHMQSVNLDTETGEVMCSFARVQQSQVNSSSSFTINPGDSTHLMLGNGSPVIVAGVWINVSASTITGLSTGDYYVLSNASSFTSAQLASTYNGAAITGLGATGTATATLKKNLGLPIAYAIERYSDGTNFQFRYYLVDTASLVWVYDTATADSTKGLSWFLPQAGSSLLASGATGIGVLNGILFVFSGLNIGYKNTVNLGESFSVSSVLPLESNSGSPNPHFAFVGHTNRLYYTDGPYISSIFPNTSLITSGTNVQSYSKWTAPTSADNTKGTVTVVINGTLPCDTVTSKRVPAVFFPATGGTLPSALSANTTYYIAMVANANTFNVYAAASGGSALDITTGSSGAQYFNTFQIGGTTSYTVTAPALVLPTSETAQSMTEVGTTLIIGTKSNYLYPWNQVDPAPGDLIPMPEADAKYMITVNNMAYVLAGNKGNIYLTSGSAAARALSVPDYCAGIAGTPSSYIEPYFIWGGLAYIRGRIYFSIQDQTSAKTGNCGGVWSFIPTQNLFYGQDVGLSLRLENQASYGTYNGMSPVIIPAQQQNAVGTQYWNAWTSSISSPLYGIDSTSTTPSTVGVIETDLVDMGYFLSRRTPTQIGFKLAAPADTATAVSMKYRLNLTDAFTSCGTAIVEGTTPISGYFPANFENTQWLQLQATLTPSVSPTSSFIRLTEIRIR